MNLRIQSETQAYKARILIVDDIPENLQILNHVLSDEQYLVRAAISGTQALQILPKFNPDLILLDISMPDIDGYQVITQIKTNPATSEIPVIFLTAKALSEDIVKGFRCGASDYVTKPFKTEELLIRINTHLNLRFRTQELKQINLELEKIVDARTYELQLANNKLSKLDKAKNDFLLLVNHELRTPIHGISGFLQLLEEQSLPAEFTDYISMLSASTNRLLKLSESALLITSVQTGYQNINFQPININSLVRQSLVDHQEAILIKNLKVNKHPDTENAEVLADSKLAVIALNKIFENALRHSSVNDTIYIDTYSTEQFTSINISDQGTGFLPETLQNLFHFFHSGTTTNQTFGFGLGLATVKLIMELQEGSIQAYNNKEGHATVELIFKSTHQKIHTS